MLRESGVSSTPRLFDVIAHAMEYWIARFRGHDTVPYVAPGLLRVFPGCLRQRHGALGGLHGLGIRRGAVANPACDALGDAGQPEQVVGEIPVQVGHASAGDVAVDLRRLVHARNVERGEIGVDQTGHGPLHQQIGEVGHRIAERRQFPVEHRLHPRLGGMENHVVEAVVAVNDGNALLFRHACAAATRLVSRPQECARSPTRDIAWSSGRPGARNNCRACRNRRARSPADRRCAVSPASRSCW